MKEIRREPDELGQLVIYVQQCDKYKVENPDKPRVMLTDLYCDE